MTIFATIFAFHSGAASDLIAHRPRKSGDLSAKQLAWCRRKLRGFKSCERAALRVRREAERSRQQMEGAQ